jgi:large subunit ribosomal protein L13
MAWNKKVGMPKVVRKHHTIDAEGKPVGRVSTQIAKLLQGKHRADYVAHVDMGDFVDVINASKVVFTGKKWDQKVHFHVSGRPGGIRSVPVSTLRENKPEIILEHAIRYMIPKNKHQKDRLKRLKITK